MGIYNVKKCSTPNCPRNGRNKGLVRGRQTYGLKCHICHRNRSLIDIEMGYTLDKVPNPKCERCGWCDAPCDRHKVDPSLGYIKGNVRILCPNCHRLVTLGLIKFD